MTAGWLAWVLAISALLALAAAAAARVLRLQRRPSRWAWSAGLLATAATPLVPRVLAAAARRWPGAGGPSGVGTAPGSPTGHDAAAGALAPFADALTTPVPDALATVLAGMWAAASATLAVLLLGGWLRLRRRSRRWPERRAAGEVVRISAGLGPATAGVLRPVVIVPRWLLREGGHALRMAVAHEREHARCRDPALLALGRALVALVPWNPFLWWQLRRLRLAVELDCDRRLLDRGLPRRAYGRLLLDVSATGPAGAPGAVTTLSERSTHLERRIRAMTDDDVPFRTLRSVALVGISLGLLAAACETPAPPAPADGPGVRAAVDSTGDDAASADASTSSFRLRAASIRIRGNTALDAEELPLIYVDGERVDAAGWLGDGDRSPPARTGPLDPDRIRSIRVLKGESAVARYGEAGAEGVLLITTEDGTPSDG